MISFLYHENKKWTFGCAQRHEHAHKVIISQYCIDLKLEKTKQNSLSDRSTSNNTVYILGKIQEEEKNLIYAYACWSELYLTGLETILKFVHSVNGQRSCSFKEETSHFSSKITTQNF